MHFEFDKNKNYLLACSFGPDSMALLDMMVKDGYHPVVCHVNYHHRPESDSEENGLRLYCSKHDLEIEVFDARTVSQQGNFEAWARNVRYCFFQNIYKKRLADGIFIAHQQDDLLETYLMQKGRKNLVVCYGIAEETILFGMKVFRPLLDFTKASLRDYCDKNTVPYSIDSSNLSDLYLRNRIRHNIIAPMSQDERKKLCAEISQKNDRLQSMNRIIMAEFPSVSFLSIPQILKLSDEEFNCILYRFLTKAFPSANVSKSRVREIRKVCLSKKPNVTVPIGRKFILIKSYDFLKVLPRLSLTGYAYTMKIPGTLDTPFFTADFSGDSSNRHVTLSDYPITIRTFLPGDEILVGKIIKKINRLFIDWKMPIELRARWPIIADKNGKPIYIPRYSPGFVSPPFSNFKVK